MKVLRGLLLVFNLLLVLATFSAYLAPHAAPNTSKFIATCGLLLPILFIGNLLFCLFWSYFKSKLGLISLVTILLGYPSLSEFFNWSSSEQIPAKQTTLGIGTYNMQFSKPVTFLKGVAQKEKAIQFERFLKSIAHLDILALQEFDDSSREYVQRTTDFTYQFQIPSIYTAIYSKYPLINQGFIDFGQPINRCIWADIVVAEDTIRFYSIHLEPNRYDGKIPLVKDPMAKEVMSIEKLIGLLKYYDKFATMRSNQAEMIRAHQRSSPYPCIIAGDLNDTPSSFTINRMSKGLKDTFLAVGRGIGATIKIYVPSLRIDYLFVDQTFKVLNHKVHENDFSDHLLVEAAIQFEDK